MVKAKILAERTKCTFEKCTFAKKFWGPEWGGQKSGRYRQRNFCESSDSEGVRLPRQRADL